MIVKDFLIFIRDVALFLFAWIVFLPLSIINYILVVVIKESSFKNYFYSSAMAIDKFGNRELRTLWNLLLRTSQGYKFGDERETISSALGKNKRYGTLSITGKLLDWVLNLFDKNHSLKSIRDNL